MGWDKTVAHLKKYREDRGKSLNNEQAERWFMSDVDSTSDLLDSVFDRTEENAEWESKYADKDKVLRLQALQLKVSFLAGCARDIRTLYAAATENRPRTAVDHDRMEFMQCGFNLAKIDQLSNIIKGMEA